ncbi:MAG: hypothetical protein JKY54_09790, partial [Flavobacteriales bacterium]|nr:hypothetical protein [Flavobacteriales bacterium]
GIYPFSFSVDVVIKGHFQSGGVRSTITKTLGISEDHPKQIWFFEAQHASYYTVTALYPKTQFNGNGDLADALAQRINLIAAIRHKTKVAAKGDKVEALFQNFIAQENKVDFSWTSIIDYPFYEFQIQRLYDGGIVSWQNGTTIQVTDYKKEIRLLLAEGSGIYAWRVRPIGSQFEGGFAHSSNWGEWNANSPVEGVPANNYIGNRGNGIFSYNELEPNRNFTYTRSFSEHNKFSEGITYINELGAVEQSQVKWSNENPILVQGTYFDYTGRGLVNTLIAPDKSNNGRIQYRPELLKVGKEEFAVKHFDRDHKILTPDVITGGVISDYYSNENTDPNIPSAEGYPYSRTFYSSDGLNTPKKVGTPGHHHHLRPTESELRNPSVSRTMASESELIRVFGDEAPAENKVIKQITTDENGMSSVTYINNKGQVIASCISERSQYNSAAIEISKGTKETLDWYNLNDIVYNESNKTASINGNFVVEGEIKEVYFSYNFIKEQFRVNCSSLCVSCDYELVVQLTGEDEDGFPSFENKPIYNLRNNPNPNCVQETIRIAAGEERIFALDPGTYSVNMVLKPIANENYIEQYVATEKSKIRLAIDEVLNNDLTYGSHTPITNIAALLEADNLEELNAYLERASWANADVTFDLDKGHAIRLANCETIYIPKMECYSPCTQEVVPTAMEYLLENVQSLDAQPRQVYEVLGTNPYDLSRRFMAENDVNDYSTFNDFFDRVINASSCEFAFNALDRMIERYNIEVNMPADQKADYFMVFIDYLHRHADGVLPVIEWNGVSSEPYGDHGYLSHAHHIFYSNAPANDGHGLQWQGDLNNDGHVNEHNGPDPEEFEFTLNNVRSAMQEFKYLPGAGEIINPYLQNLWDAYRASEISFYAGVAIAPTDEELLLKMAEGHRLVGEQCYKTCDNKLVSIRHELEDMEGIPVVNVNNSNGDAMVNYQMNSYINLPELDCKVLKFRNFCHQQCNRKIYITNPDDKAIVEDSIAVNGVVNPLIISPESIDSVGTTIQNKFMVDLTWSIPEILDTKSCKDSVGAYHIEGQAVAPQRMGISIRPLNEMLKQITQLALNDGMDKAFTSVHYLAFLNAYGIPNGDASWSLNRGEVTIIPRDNYEFITREGEFCKELILMHSWLIEGATPGDASKGDSELIVICNNFCYNLPGDCPGICIRFNRPFENIEIPQEEVYTCTKRSIDDIFSQLESDVARMELEIEHKIEQQYEEVCMRGLTAQLSYSMTKKYDFYTLFYYDRAGRLIKTVAPEGVQNGLNDLANDAVAIQRGNRSHNFKSEYTFNSIGETEKVETPDGGTAQFLYDDLGRLRFTQNLQQAKISAFAYVKYDHLGRVIESGKAFLVAGQAFKNLREIATSDQAFPTHGNEQEQVFNFYNTAVAGIAYLGKPQRFLQNKISYTLSKTTLGDVTTYYSYNAIGIVEWSIKELPQIGRKSVSFDYELISGNILQANYNKGETDQFFHRYSYDAQNRMVKTETSVDEVVWDREESLAYYDHGAVKRKEIGNDNLQGQDYVYTLNGNLKALNTAKLDPAFDPSNDGINDFAADAFGYEMFYYHGDYMKKASYYDNTSKNAANNLHNTLLTAEVTKGDRSLYNGGIAAIAWSNKGSALKMQNANKTIAYKYNYDQLYRLKSANYNIWDHNLKGLSATLNYGSKYTYDRNGNITTLQRDAYGKNRMMDRLTYNYQKGTNRLSGIADKHEDNFNWIVDLKNQEKLNYEYNANGELISDQSENIKAIKWSATGKVLEIQKKDGSKIEFAY